MAIHILPQLTDVADSILVVLPDMVALLASSIPISCIQFIPNAHLANTGIDAALAIRVTDGAIAFFI